MSEIIPKEKLGGFQRWQFGSFDQPEAATVAPALPEEANDQASEPVASFNLPTAIDIERIHEDARRVGYQDGFNEGQLAAEHANNAATQAEVERFRSLAEGLHKALDELDQNVADQLLTLATEIAAQVVRRAIAVDNELLLPIIREAITALPLHHSHVQLRLNPADAGKIRPLLNEQLVQNGMQIIEDSEITLGGCLVRAGTSEVDATIETRWKRVLDAIGAEPQAWLKS